MVHNMVKMEDTFYLGCISLLMPKLPKLPNQCYLNGPGNLGDLGSNKEVQLSEGETKPSKVTYLLIKLLITVDNCR